MSQKRKSFKSKEDLNLNKYGKIEVFILFFLIIGIFACLICGWLSGDKELNKISDNIVTSSLQNYNYLVATACLIPTIAYLYSKIKKKFENLYISESQVMMYGFFAVLIVLVAIISACSIVYPINSSTWYGINSQVTVGIFLCPVVILVLETIIYCFLIIPELIANKIFWKTVRKNLPIILLVLFLIFTFISCMLAPDAADDIIGAEKAKEVGASPNDVLAKTLNGCYNLKDGFWAFLMYGAVMLGAAVLGKDRLKEKKFLIKSFVIVMLLLSVITLAVTAYGGYLSQKYESQYDAYKKNIESFEFDKELTKEDFQKYAAYEANNVYNNWFVYPQRSIFRNSNHFAYVLCMAVMAAAVLAITEKNLFEKLFYVFSFTILTYMLILNDTFGGYLGVLVALICLAILGIYNIFVNVLNRFDVEKKKKILKICFSVTVIIEFICILFLKLYWINSIQNYIYMTIILLVFELLILALLSIIYLLIKKMEKELLLSILCFLIIASIFSIVSFNAKDEGGNVIAVRNINDFANDIGIFSRYVISEENNAQSDNDNQLETNTQVETNTLDETVAKAGSGRGETWIKIWELVKQRPVFGYGLECLLFQFSGQFGINEGRTHNLLLQLLGTVGIPGTIMYFLALAIIFIRLLKNWKTWDDAEKICIFAGIAYIITAFTGNSTYYTSPFFMMFLGFVLFTPWKRENK